MDASTSLFAPGGLPLGMLAMLLSQQPPAAQANAAPNDQDMANATAQLAAKMRQQSTDVPPPEGQPAAGPGDTFDQKWSGILNSPLPENLPLPQPRPNDAIKQSQLPTMKSVAAPDNGLDQSVLDALPANSTPTQGVVRPSVAPAAPSAGPSLGDRLMAGFANFGAGGKAGGLLGALSGAIGGATTGIRMDPLGAMNQTVQALTNRGMSPDLAQIMARDPQMLNQVLPLIMGVKPWQVTQVKDMFGQEKPILINPLTGESRAVNISGGAPRGAMSSPTISGMPGVTPNPVGVSAPANATPTLDNFDMNTVNPNLKGADYVKQFPPEVQSAVQAYLQGGVMPTGNPRNQGISTVAKMVAQKYAMDIGQPQLADDALFSQRRKMRTDLGASSPNSLGGILSNGKSAFQHLAGLSDSFVDLGNYNGPNMPGGGRIGEAGNIIGNSILPTATTLGKMRAVKDNSLKYGQEATKFYAGTGGGEAERMGALNDVGGAGATADEQAAFLAKEKELMLDRLGQKEAQIRDTLGDQYLAQHPVMTPDLRAAINKIDANIAKLRGQAPAQAAQSGAAPTQADALSQAREAIAKGANRTQVILRLQKMGVNTAGL